MDIPADIVATLDGEVKMTQATFVNGPKKLPIRFEVNQSRSSFRGIEPRISRFRVWC